VVTTFPLVYQSYMLMLTVHVSVAKNERSFSKLKLIKNYGTALDKT